MASEAEELKQEEDREHKEAEEEKHLEEEEQKQEELEEFQPVVSSMVDEVAFAEEEILVRFVSGSEEGYGGTQKQFEELLLAPSVGKWMWANYGDELNKGRS